MIKFVYRFEFWKAHLLALSEMVLKILNSIIIQALITAHSDDENSQAVGYAFLLFVSLFVGANFKNKFLQITFDFSGTKLILILFQIKNVLILQSLKDEL